MHKITLVYTSVGDLSFSLDNGDPTQRIVLGASFGRPKDLSPAQLTKVAQLLTDESDPLFRIEVKDWRGPKLPDKYTLGMPVSPSCHA